MNVLVWVCSGHDKAGLWIMEVFFLGIFTERARFGWEGFGGKTWGKWTNLGVVGFGVDLGLFSGLVGCLISAG